MSAATGLDLSRYQADQALLLAELEAAGAEIKKPNAIRCPWHDDANPSAGVYCRDGVWRFKCHGCGLNFDVFDVRAKHTGRDLAEAIREIAGPADSSGPRQRGSRAAGAANGAVGGSDVPEYVPDDPGAFCEPEPDPSEHAPKIHPTFEALQQAALFSAQSQGGTDVEQVFQYTDPATKRADLIVFRIRTKRGTDTGKTFRQAHPVEGGFVLRGPEGLWPLYNRGRVAQADTVWIVEGEKCVHAMHDAGAVATTNPGGANKVEQADWTPLAGKRCILWPDHDPEVDGRRKGHEHMRAVAERLGRMNCKLSWVEPETLGLADKQDCVDFLDRFSAGERPGQLAEVAREAMPINGASCLYERVAAMVSGRIRTLDCPWPTLRESTHAWRTQTVTILCGAAGISKSLMLLQLCLHWIGEGEPVALYELEEDRAFHQQRALAFLEGHWKYADPDYVADHPEEVREAIARHEALLDPLGRAMSDAPREIVEPDDVLDWTRDRFQAGCRVVAIDPITAIEPGQKRWIADQEFVLRSKDLARDHHGLIVWVTHPKDDSKGSSLDNIAGGRAYRQFTQCVLWVQGYDETKLERCRVLGPASDINPAAPCNCEVRACKVRNSFGRGLRIGMYREKSGYLKEQGIITKRKDSAR